MTPKRRGWTFGALLLSLTVVSACNQGTTTDTREGEIRNDAGVATADAQQERTEEIEQLNERVTELEREYAEARQEVVTGEAVATAGLREELKEDVSNVRQAVNDLRTTTPENWWERHEETLSRTASEIEDDVERLAGKIPPATPEESTASATGGAVAAEAFTSRRDEFVRELRARVDAMERALENVDASGPRQTEIEDSRARVRKLGEDVDRLRTASAEDWWELTRDRVRDYVDRVENSVDRLTANEPRAERR